MSSSRVETTQNKEHTVEDFEKRILRDQILRIIVALPYCADGDFKRACPSCEAEAIAEHVAVGIDTTALKS